MNAQSLDLSLGWILGLDPSRDQSQSTSLSGFKSWLDPDMDSGPFSDQDSDLDAWCFRCNSTTSCFVC